MSRFQTLTTSTANRVAALRLSAAAPSYKAKAFIADHSGTYNDRFVIGPCLGFTKAYEAYGVPTTTAMWRRNMGYAKPFQIALENAHPDDPIRESERYPEFGLSGVRLAFIEHKGREPNEADTNELVKLFFEVQNPALVEVDETGHRCVDALPQAKPAHDLAIARGLKTGGTTGFPRENCNVLLDHLEQQGIKFDTFVAPDDLPGDMGVRVKPHSMWENMRRLSISYAREVVKVDDTPAGIGEGNNSGAWTVGLLEACNHLYVNTVAEWNAMDENERTIRYRNALVALNKARPHFILNHLEDIEPVLDAIDFMGFHGIAPHDVRDTCVVLDNERLLKWSKL